MTTLTGSEETESRREQLIASMAPTALAMLAGMLVSRVVSAVWARRSRSASTGSDDGELAWTGAIVSAAVLGAVAGVTRLLVRRGTQRRLEQRALARRAARLG